MDLTGHVQLGALLLAAERFPWFVVVDRDSYIGESYPVEFRSKEALVEHIRRMLEVEHPEYLLILQQRGIIDDNCQFALPH